jgi:hypothetical protein
LAEQLASFSLAVGTPEEMERESVPQSTQCHDSGRFQRPYGFFVFGCPNKFPALNFLERLAIGEKHSNGFNY